ncbi:MAG: EAL domain-containing protein [Chloroflexi bacterium]|nr:EAL domain-containing protein [Chloroflexota bacterium]
MLSQRQQRQSFTETGNTRNETGGQRGRHWLCSAGALAASVPALALVWSVLAEQFGRESTLTAGLVLALLLTTVLVTWRSAMRGLHARALLSDRLAGHVDALERDLVERARVDEEARLALEREIAERRQAEAALRASAAEARKLAHVASRTDNAVVIADARGYIEWVNESFTRITGYSLDDVRGKRPGAVLQGPGTDPAAVHFMRERLRSGQAFTTEICNYARDGRTYWVALEVQPVRDEAGQVVNFIGIQRETTAERAVGEQLYQRAFHDPLTGLPNRALFMDRATQVLKRLERNPLHRFAILLLDLDRFKLVNDTLGHLAGDDLLVQIARRLEAGVRPVDTVARLGGDEFVILLDDLDEAELAEQIAERLLVDLRQPFDLDGHEALMSASIGIAVGDRRYECPEDVLRDADMATYHAKARGKSRYAVFDAVMHARNVQTHQLELDLRRAVEHGELFPEYQPIVELQAGTVVGVEALLRWRHPTRGVLGPSEFIPIANETGAIVAIGEWLLRTVCTQWSAWKAGGLSVPRLAVNLSARQFRQPDLSATLRAILAETGVDPAALEVELTEATVLEDGDETIARLTELRDIGIRISIDDFGTGYSSLTYLRQLPVDALKIDRAFVRGVAQNREDRAIVATLIALGRSLQLRVVAEGVETREQLLVLRDQGCHAIQGNVFSRPLAAADVERIARAGRRLALPLAASA